MAKNSAVKLVVSARCRTSPVSKVPRSTVAADAGHPAHPGRRAQLHREERDQQPAGGHRARPVSRPGHQDRVQTTKVNLTVSGTQTSVSVPSVARAVAGVGRHPPEPVRASTWAARPMPARTVSIPPELVASQTPAPDTPRPAQHSVNLVVSAICVAVPERRRPDVGRRPSRPSPAPAWWPTRPSTPRAPTAPSRATSTARPRPRARRWPAAARSTSRSASVDHDHHHDHADAPRRRRRRRPRRPVRRRRRRPPNRSSSGDRRRRPAAPVGSGGRRPPQLAQEVGQQRRPRRGQDRLGVELHALDRQRAVAQSHDHAVASRWPSPPSSSGTDSGRTTSEW